MKYLLNSAVLGSGAYGTYEYAPATVEELSAFVRQPYTSRIGYPDTREFVYQLTGIRPVVSREMSVLAPGDEAMIVRLRYRVDPAAKGAPVSWNPADWEIAKLKRVI